MPRKTLPAEALVDLSTRLATLPSRSYERRLLIATIAQAYGVSDPTLYRALAEQGRPKSLRRAECGVRRLLSADETDDLADTVCKIRSTANSICLQSQKII